MSGGGRSGRMADPGRGGTDLGSRSLVGPRKGVALKRLAVLLATATAALAFASSASANPYLAVSGNGVADGNYFAFAAVHIFDADGGGAFLNPIDGNLLVIAMDPSGTMHSFEGV